MHLASLTIEERRVMNDKSKIKIAFVSTYPPRRCGIATFTKSHLRVMNDLYVADPISVIAVSDEKGLYEYGKEVVFEIDQYNERSYARAAEFVNTSDIEVVSLQHEYGIFGGDDGEYILKFLENVNKPVVTNLHSVLNEHSEHRYRLTQRILDLSDSVVVMTKNARKMLIKTFAIEPNKIQIVSHGVPNVRFDEKEASKQKLGLEGKTVFSTFGLINRGKGIEFALDAVGELAKECPNITYLIVGATHPDILKREGESYRNALKKRSEKLGITHNVKFVNEFLGYEELVEYLKATDIYLAPQLDLKQSFSGTLSYAIGCGDAVISSPTEYANEILARGRGVIAEPRTQSITNAAEDLLKSYDFLRKTQLKAYRFARPMIWPQVCLQMLRVFESNLFIKKEKWQQRLPEFSERPSLRYLESMTTSIGLVQHSRLDKPNMKFGYSLDDQARALIASVKYLKDFDENEKVFDLITVYLSYLDRAVDSDGVIHNFIDKRGNFADGHASPDSISRSFWALSYVATSDFINAEIRERAESLLGLYRNRIRSTFLRPTAYNLLGFTYLKEEMGVVRLANNLVDRFEVNAENGWQWFEEDLTWGNAIVPYALVKAYGVSGDQHYLEIALRATEFLDRVSRYKSIPMPIGQDGWYRRGSRKAIFDQQPIEAADMVLLYNELYYTTQDDKYRQKAAEWMGWFFGNNILDNIMYDNVTRGVYDGLTRRGPNRNQGAESIVVYLLAYLSFSSPDREEVRSGALQESRESVQYEKS